MSLTELPAFVLLVFVFVLTGLSAYFSSSETAMIALNRYRLRHLVKQKHRGARKANRLLRRPDRLLGVILIGNNLVNFTAASIATVIGLRLFGDTGVVQHTGGGDDHVGAVAAAVGESQFPAPVPELGAGDLGIEADQLVDAVLLRGGFEVFLDLGSRRQVAAPVGIALESVGVVV